MASRPKTVPPTFRYKFWIEERGKSYYDVLYHCRRADLEKAIAESGIPNKLIMIRMGAGYHYMAEALAGKRLDRWAISHIETGLAALKEQEVKDYRLEV